VNQIIAVQPPGRYLVADPATRLGRVLDTAERVLYPPSPVDTIASRGYWEEYDGPQDALSGLLEGVREIAAPEERTR